MQERLTYLLTRYLAKTASDEEIEEFKAVVGLPEHEAFIKAEIEKALDEGSNTGASEQELGERIYSRITGENEIQPKNRTFLSFFRTMAAAAVIILAIGIGWYLSGKRQGKQEMVTAIRADKETTRIYSTKSFIRLPDGSTVMLKDSSELVVLEKDGKFLREVILKGEAFFDISHDKAHTFVVHADKVDTRVLGTAFNIRTQAGKVEVQVTRGLVEVGSNQANQAVYGKIKAREQIRVNTDSNAFTISAIKQVQKVPVSSSALNFEETSLTEVFSQIAEKYHYQVFLENPELGPCRITAKFAGGEDLENILDAICAIRNLEYSTELDKILIKGGVPCK